MSQIGLNSWWFTFLKHVVRERDNPLFHFLIQRAILGIILLTNQERQTWNDIEISLTLVVKKKKSGEWNFTNDENNTSININKLR